MESLIGMMLFFEKNHSKSAAYFYSILGSALASLDFLFIKLATMKAGIFQISMLRCMFALITNSVVTTILKIDINADTKGDNLKALCMRGLLGIVVTSGWFFSIQYIGLSETLVLVLMTPIYTYIFGLIILKEKFKISDIMLCILSIIGVILIFKPNLFENNEMKNENKTSLYNLGILIAFSTGVIRAFGVIILKSLAGKASTLTINFFFQIFGILGAQILQFQFEELSYLSPMQYFYVMCAGIVGCFSQALFARSLIFENSGKITSVQYVSVIFSLFYDVFIFGYDIKFISIVGVFIVIASIVLLLIKNIKSN